jgi:plastocyanin
VPLALAACLALGACRAGPVIENPAGYPPIPQGRAAAPAPTPGGAVPTAVGVGRSPAASREGETDQGASAQGAIGPVAGNSGIYQAMGGAGSASFAPAPAATRVPTPQPVATVTISRERGFEPAQVTIDRGDAVLWRNDDRSPQTVTGDPALAVDRAHVALPAGARPWGSQVLNHGASYVQAFEVPGEYAYFSTSLERQGVVGRITVR